MDNGARLWFYLRMQYKTFRAGKPSAGGYRRHPRKRRRGLISTIVLALLALLLLYLLFPFGTQRVVLLGSDARADEASRSDTILVTAAGGNDGMLAVPRDTLVRIPGVGQDKINAAFASGGPELTVETLEGFLDLRINNYVVVNFEGVEEIVNAMGGVNMDVQEPIPPVEPGGPSVPPGEQVLNGEEALAYVRDRSGPTADIGRAGRQQEFMQAVMRQSLSPANWPRLPAVAAAVWRNVETNMNPVEAARFLVQLQLAGERPTEIYPGTPQYIDGVSYWVPDKAAGEQAINETIG